MNKIKIKKMLKLKTNYPLRENIFYYYCFKFIKKNKLFIKPRYRTDKLFSYKTKVKLSLHKKGKNN